MHVPTTRVTAADWMHAQTMLDETLVLLLSMIDRRLATSLAELQTHFAPAAIVEAGIRKLCWRGLLTEHEGMLLPTRAAKALLQSLTQPETPAITSQPSMPSRPSELPAKRNPSVAVPAAESSSQRVPEERSANPDRAGRITVVRIQHQYLAESELSVYKSKLMNLVEERQGEILIDLQEVRHLSSVFVGVLITLHGAAKKRGGRVALVNVAANVAEVFKITKLDKLIHIYAASDLPTMADATTVVI